MRNIFLVFIASMVTLNPMYSQIKIKYTEPAPTPHEKVFEYDSTDVSDFRPERYYGQKVIYYQKSYLFTPDYSKVAGTKPYECPLFTYFEIVDYKNQRFQLKRIDNGDICYYTHFGDGTKAVMAVGYYERYVNNMMNTLWAIEGKDGIYKIVDIWLREGGISQKLQSITDTTTIELKTMFRQKNLSRYNHYIEKFKDEEWIVDCNLAVGRLKGMDVIDGHPQLIFVTNSGKEYNFDLERSMQGYCNNGLSIGIAPNFTKKQSDEYIRKFGIRRWKEVLEGVVTIGMTQEMVLLTMGFQPSKEIIMTDPSGKAVQWSFANSMDVLIVNGRVKHITHY